MQGVVNITDNVNYNCSSLVGSTSSLGNGIGRASSTINEINGTQVQYTEDGKTSISWRGIENPYGNIWEHIHGITLLGDGTQMGGIPYVCTDRDYSEFSTIDTVPENYKKVKFAIANANGYISGFGYDPDFDWLFLTTETNTLGASNVVPVGDYTYLAPNLNGACTVFCGAYWYSGAWAGLFCWALRDGVGTSWRGIGGRAVFAL